MRSSMVKGRMDMHIKKLWLMCDSAESRMEWQEYFSQLQDTTDALTCHIHLPICFWIMDPHSGAPKKNISHGNEVLPQDSTHSSCKDHITNKEVHAKIQQAVGQHEDLLMIVKRCKLQWYGYVSSSSGLPKTILQGIVKGGRRQCRQRKRWEGNIKEWTGLEFCRSQRAEENREKWRKLVAKSSVVPQWPLQLRDRWWWLYTDMEMSCIILCV